LQQRSASRVVLDGVEMKVVVVVVVVVVVMVSL
jgi:hypothetical protein